MVKKKMPALNDEELNFIATQKTSWKKSWQPAEVSAKVLYDIVEDSNEDALTRASSNCTSFYSVHADLSNESRITSNSSKDVSWPLNDDMKEASYCNDAYRPEQSTTQSRKKTLDDLLDGDDASTSSRSYYSLYAVLDGDDMSTSRHSTYTTDTFLSTESLMRPSSSRRLWRQMFIMLGFVVVVSTSGMLRGYLNTMARLQQERIMFVPDKADPLPYFKHVDFVSYIDDSINP
mmetsp:Transcript_23587/g.34806  ORF Transcript_23587/g.34806 Transcript_23587/m.34806 type:complete len:233 (-) Transcript_23587:219-917(-)